MPGQQTPLVKSLSDALFRIPSGRVVTLDVLCKHLSLAPHCAARSLVDIRRQMALEAPWHRVVAKGGAIGRGAHRDEQIARLRHEGVPVSPAGIVQRIAIVSFDEAARVLPSTISASPQPEGLRASRSRGMRDRP